MFDETSVVDRHRCQMTAMFGVFVDVDYSRLPTLYWKPKLMNDPLSRVLLLILVLVLLPSCQYF